MYQILWKRILFLILIQATAINLSGFSQKKSGNISGVNLAKKHVLIYNKPAPDFFEGALLGNGGLGVVVTTRPDAIVLRFGHNNVWDIRIAEDNLEKIGTFQSVFDKVKKISADLPNLTDDPWYREYNRMTGENYSKPYPRPFPCGSLVLGFDKRKVQVLGHELDISNGLCTVKLLTADQEVVFLKLFTTMKKDQLWIELTDKNGQPRKNLFNRVRLIPDPSTPSEFPKFEAEEILKQGMISFKQVLPGQEQQERLAKANYIKDRAFSLTLTVNQQLEKKTRTNWNGNQEYMSELEAGLTATSPFLAMVSLKEGLENTFKKETQNTADPLSTAEKNAVFADNVKIWEAYWAKSAVKLDDNFLEQIWYRNLYFFNCAAKDGITCPGIFANWSYDKIGTAWHGDYHMNYNTQQPFWMTFSSNHLEKNLPYVKLIESLMPVSRKWAKDYYQLPGAYFPHSAYPVEMSMNPYPIPDWGWELSETPWAVQGLWWHYLYSGDTMFLKDRAYEPLKAAVEFLAAYMKRPDARDPKRFKDGKFHIFPSVPPELYGLRPGFKYNYDSSVDLTLTKFVFNAFKKATEILKTTAQEKNLIKDINMILADFPDYPTARSQEYKKIFVSVPEEHDQVVYNVPNALFTVFPGEDHGLHSDAEILGTLKNTYRNQQNEGGNDLVFINMQAARIGMLDLEEFKRHVNYSLLPNGTATDMVVQTGGRYNDQTDFDYMAKMGIWFENFALPAVINECLLQGYNGTVSVFPNWPKDKDAEFNQLRTAGAFLVSAKQHQGRVQEISVLSEKGNDLHILLPWKSGTYVERNAVKKLSKGTELTLHTKAGERITFFPAEN